MRIFFFSCIFLTVMGIGSACNDSQSKVFSNRIRIEYSPDKRKNVEIYEAGLDSIDCSTQVMVNFKNSGTGIYSVLGINKGINVYWKDNSTVVIETFTSYHTDQKLSQAQSFGDIVKVEYIEK